MRNISLRSLVVVSGLISIAAGSAIFLAKAQKAQDKQVPRSAGRFEKPDLITDAIRDAGNEFVSIRVGNESERESAKASGTVIADYGAEIVVARRKSSSDSLTGLDERKLDTRISLPGRRFEPGVVPIAARESAAPQGKEYYIVQFGAHAKDEWLDSIRDLGAEIIQYVPNRAFIVYADAAAAESLRAHSRVRWSGLYRAEDKVSELGRGRAESYGAAQAEFHVAVFKRSDLSVVYGQISSIPGIEILEVQEPPSGFFDLFTVRVSGESVERISKITDVFRIDPYEKPAAEDERAAQIVAGNYTSTTTIAGPGYDPLAQFGVDGTGVTVAISDDGVSIPGNGGFYITAANTVDGPLRGATAGAEGNHGHINASIVAGAAPFGTLDPTNYNYGKGIAPGSHIINIPFLKTGNTTTDSQSVDDTVSTAGPNGVKGSIINNSWGSGTNSNSYDSFAALWDGFVFDASFAGTRDPITVVFSAGNSGSSGLTRPKMAKNVIAVGNSENLRTELGGGNADNIDDMRGSSSRGPAADGRIKPDITAPGTYISGARAGSTSGVWGAIDANHVFSGGTSHSAPQVAGVAALFTQFWKNNNGGELPQPSLVKAAILNSGIEMNAGNPENPLPSDTLLPLPNGDEGWGRVNMKLIFDSGASTVFQNETAGMLEPGFATTIDGVVESASKPLRIALVWTDPPGASDPALVNDLDLTVTVGSEVYKGNVFSDGTSVSGGDADTVNNVEMVRLPAGIAAGTPVSIEVRSIALNGDGIPGNGDSTDQTYSLVAYNVSEEAAGSDAVFDFDGDGATDVSVFRPDSQPTAQWWLLRSSDSGTRGLAFGTSTDVPVAADFTGDGKTDVAFWRPSTGEWFILRSEDDSFFAFPFGANGDIPAPGDFDGDGKADPAVYRPSSGTWFIVRSSDGGLSVVPFGVSADQPIVADYDGDGKDDVGVYRAPDNQFWLLRSTDGVKAFQFGAPGDRTAVGDWTGDGKADVAFFRPSSSEWYVIRSEDDSFFAFPWGAAGDIPSPGDFDGDGLFDPAVWRPSDRTWYIFGTTSGFEAVQFGSNGDVPLPSSVSVQ